jgi:D-amino-acid dehydrogenase
MLGARVPIEGGKGYSFFVTPSVVPRHSILLADVHVGCTPLGDRMRIGGTMEFSGLNTRLDRRRIATIVKGAESSFLPWASAGIDTEWAGMRPIAPDGLPVLDHLAAYPNVFVASGYSMQGVTLAAPAAVSLCDFVLTGRRPELLEPFRVDRFDGLRLPVLGHVGNGRV